MGASDTTGLAGPHARPSDPTQAATPNDTHAPGGTSPAGTSVIGPGSVVGRHVVLARLGAGGMGVVHAAYDPELDRKIALKLLLPGTGGETGRLRLLREAQALARLSHPNVVAIHDVGTIGEQVWLAMEFVQGQTLGKWLKTPHGWRAVLELMLEAGKGLAAAHAVGLLHRDFKPDNVMVGDDGRVRVMDFGLARVDASAEPLEVEAPGLAAEPKRALETNVTRVGVIVGTPSYMAAEQFDGQPLTAAVDQFAFCVTLWEALYGERPFGGGTPREIVGRMLASRVRSPPKGRIAPSWLRRACERGLAIDPAQRWPSMDALLDTLAKGRMRAGVRKGLAVAGVVVLLGAGVEAQRRWGVTQRTAACEATGDEIAEVWSPAREQALREAFVATKASFAPMAADRATQWLARQAEAWREARAETCLDADVRGRWDADTLDRSLWCLDARRMELESLVDELAHADAQVVITAVKAAATLAPVAACRDEHALATMPRPPAADREALRAIRGEVIRAGNLERAGRYDDGLALARGALARAEALAWPPLVAEARLRVGWLLERKGSFVEAEAELERAYFDAGKGGAPEVALDAALGLVRTVGLDAARHVEGRRWARLADMALDGLPDGEGLRRALLSSVLANVEHAAGSFDAARQLHEQALALQEAAVGEEHPGVATSLYNLANTDYATGRFEAAEQRYEQAIAISEAVLGPEHPDVANMLNNLAAVRHATGAYEDVAALHTRVLAIRERALGPRHPDVAVSLANLGVVLTATGHHAEAAARLERANSIREEALGPEHPDLAQGLANLGVVYQNTGDFAQAKTFHERALAIHSKALGPEHPHVALDLNNLASIAHATGDLAEAERLYSQAITRWEAALGPEHPNLSHSLLGLAEVRLAQHRPAEALPPASRAVTIREQTSVAVEDLAAARFVLAQVSWDAPEDGGRDRARAVTLAEQARAVLRDAGEAQAASLRQVEAWLAANARDDAAPSQ